MIHTMYCPKSKKYSFAHNSWFFPEKLCDLSLEKKILMNIQIRKASMPDAGYSFICEKSFWLYWYRWFRISRFLRISPAYHHLATAFHDKNISPSAFQRSSDSLLNCIRRSPQFSPAGNTWNSYVCADIQQFAWYFSPLQDTSSNLLYKRYDSPHHKWGAAGILDCKMSPAGNFDRHSLPYAGWPNLHSSISGHPEKISCRC